jgi:amino acid transporter
VDRKHYDRLTLFSVAALSIFPITFATLFFVMLAGGPLPPWIFAFSFAASVVAIAVFLLAQSRRRPKS